MKTLFLAVSAALAAVPGLVIIKSGVGVPPDQNALFGGIIEATGALALLMLWVSRRKIQLLSERRIISWAGVAGVLFLVLLCAYLIVFGVCVVTGVQGETAYFPLRLDGKIAQMVAQTGSRQAAIDRYGIDAIYKAIGLMPDAALGFTTVVLLFTYQGIFTSLVIAFGLLGIYERQPLAASSG